MMAMLKVGLLFALHFQSLFPPPPPICFSSVKPVRYEAPVLLMNNEAKLKNSTAICWGRNDDATHKQRRPVACSRPPRQRWEHPKMISSTVATSTSYSAHQTASHWPRDSHTYIYLPIMTWLEKGRIYALEWGSKWIYFRFILGRHWTNFDSPIWQYPNVNCRACLFSGFFFLAVLSCHLNSFFPALLPSD